MIDVHCHLEQKDYDSDREEVIKRCKQELKAIITSCANPKDFSLTLELVEEHKNFVFATAGIHPEYIKEITEKEKDDFLDLIQQNRSSLVGIGEVGLDYFWVKEKHWQQKQKELFIEFIGLAKKLRMPIVVHARDAFEEALAILEQEDAGNVLMHMFGENSLTKRLIEDNYFVSVNTILLRSKKHKKIVRDMPLELLLLETDAPWLGLQGRNEPMSIRLVAEKIAEIKGLNFQEVWLGCGKNAVEFFKLPINL